MIAPDTRLAFFEDEELEELRGGLGCSLVLKARTNSIIHSELVNELTDEIDRRQNNEME